MEENLYNINIKYNDFTKNLSAQLTTQTLGDLVEKILDVLGTSQYSLEYIIAQTENKGEIIIGGNDAEFDVLVKTFIINKGNIIFVPVDRKRDENGNVIKENKFIDGYNRYIRVRNDTEIAKRMQNDINYARYMGMDQNQSHTQQLSSLFNNNDDIARIFINSMMRRNVQTSYSGAAPAATGPPQVEPVNNAEDENIDNYDDGGDEDESINSDDVGEYIDNENNNSSQDSGIDEPNDNVAGNATLGNVNISGNQRLAEYLLTAMTSSNGNMPSITQNTLSQFNSSGDIVDGFLSAIINLPVTTAPLPMPNQDNLEDVKVVLTDQEISNIECGEYSSLKDGEDICKKCPILLTDFKDNTRAMKLKCNHVFSEDGLTHWLKTESNKCPVCRKVVAKGKALI